MLFTSIAVLMCWRKRTWLVVSWLYVIMRQEDVGLCFFRLRDRLKFFLSIMSRLTRVWNRPLLWNLFASAMDLCWIQPMLSVCGSKRFMTRLYSSLYEKAYTYKRFGFPFPDILCDWIDYLEVVNVVHASITCFYFRWIYECGWLRKNAAIIADFDIESD
jgi:hypothetical protein